MRRPAFAVAQLVLGVVLGWAALAAPANAAPVELNLWPSGQGHISVTQGGAARCR